MMNNMKGADSSPHLLRGPTRAFLFRNIERRTESRLRQVASHW